MYGVCCSGVECKGVDICRCVECVGECGVWSVLCGCGVYVLVSCVYVAGVAYGVKCEVKMCKVKFTSILIYTEDTHVLNM